MKRGNVVPRLALQALAALIAVVAGSSSGQPTAPAPPAAPGGPPGLGRAPAPVPPMAASAPSAVFAIRAFQLEGENPIGEAEANRVLAPFVRPDATLETLQQATAALEAAFRNSGFGLHRVALPPQEVGATVRLNIVKFAIGTVTVENRQIYDEENIRRTVPELREGQSPNFKRLAIQTAIANENPNKQVQVGLRESDEPDRIDATITVREQRPWSFGVGLSNAGSQSTGEDRVTVTASHTNLWNRDHQFTAAYTTSFENPEDVRQFGLAYRVPLYALGGVVAATYTRSDVVGNFGAFTSTGAGHTVGVNYTLYLAPQGGSRSYVTLGIEDRVFDPTVISGQAPTNTTRRSRPVTVSYTTRVESDTSIWGYDIGIAANTGTGSNNDFRSYRSEDPRVDTELWKAIRGSASYSGPFNKTWLWSARTQFQYSANALISGEQFGLGGIGSVRGTEIDRPISGDYGVTANFELSTPELAPGLRAHGFFDAGWIGNRINTPAKLALDNLFSIGLGVRWFSGKWSAAAEYGFVLNGSKVRLAVNSFAPKRGDDRFYVNVGYRF